MTEASRLSSFAAGARDTLPMLVGAAPFGLIFGTLVATAHLAGWQGQLMSLGVFAGSSQFIAAGLMATGTGMLVIWFATFIVNLRHMLYAATLLPHVHHLPRRWRWLLGFLLTDETFAVMDGYYRRHPQAPLGHWYFLGSGLVDVPQLAMLDAGRDSVRRHLPATADARPRLRDGGDLHRHHRAAVVPHAAVWRRRWQPASAAIC